MRKDPVLPSQEANENKTNCHTEREVSIKPHDDRVIPSSVSRGRVIDRALTHHARPQPEPRAFASPQPVSTLQPSRKWLRRCLALRSQLPSRSPQNPQPQLRPEYSTLLFHSAPNEPSGG